MGTASSRGMDAYEINWEGVLGEGNFATVYSGTHIKSGKAVAVKRILFDKMKPEDVEALHEEVKILSMLDHPNIIRYHDFFETEDSYYVITEVVNGGELFDRIVKRVFYSEKCARDLVGILLSTLDHVHSMKVVHRDLKPENLLLQSLDEDSSIKIADFGLATTCLEGANLTSRCGTPGYVAPEVVRGAEYGPQVDMWSCGVIIFILLGGYPPFHADAEVDLYKKIKKAEYSFDPTYWDCVSHEAKDLISKLLVVDPAERLTAAAALRHPWFLAGDHTLMERNLEKTLQGIKSLTIRQKFRAGVDVARGLARMHSATKHPRTKQAGAAAAAAANAGTAEAAGGAAPAALPTPPTPTQSAVADGAVPVTPPPPPSS